MSLVVRAQMGGYKLSPHGPRKGYRQKRILTLMDIVKDLARSESYTDIRDAKSALRNATKRHEVFMSEPIQAPELNAAALTLIRESKPTGNDWC